MGFALSSSSETELALASFKTARKGLPWLLSIKTERGIALASLSHCLTVSRLVSLVDYAFCPALMNLYC